MSTPEHIFEKLKTTFSTLAQNMIAEGDYANVRGVIAVLVALDEIDMSPWAKYLPPDEPELRPQSIEQAIQQFPNHEELFAQLRAQRHAPAPIPPNSHVLPPRCGLVKMSRERTRQMIEKGYTPEHDDEHKGGELALAARHFLDLALQIQKQIGITDVIEWPWGSSLPPGDGDDYEQLLVKTGAMLAAEIERIDRVAVKAIDGDDIPF